MNTPNQTSELTKIVQSIFESRYLKRIPRSGTSLLLGSEVNESIIEHSYYVTLFGLVVSGLDPSLDKSKLLTMCIIHDLEEVRTGDLNQINKLYNRAPTDQQAFADMWSGSVLGSELAHIHAERDAAQTPEAIAANDCDLLAELVTEKEYHSKSNSEAQEWMDFTLQRIKSDIGKQLGTIIVKSRISGWWEDIKNNIRKSHSLPPKKY